MNNYFILNNAKEQIDISENFAGYVIFYKKNKDENVAAIQLNLFQKLIENALKISLENFLFVDLNAQKIRFSDCRKSLQVAKCFLFGVTESEIGLNIVLANYQLQTINDIEFLKIDSPEKVEQNTKLKTQLWQQLQISFKLIK